ncbi:uncharacterized protein LOC124813680 [Hydra vulgaris]|uniref:uncharacterized protein LOC124813680 n=1 Tax=Hydra vulgaris TaxID=6087 RepID=UPI0032EA42D3
MKAGISTEDDLPQDNSEITVYNFPCFTDQSQRDIAKHFFVDFCQIIIFQYTVFWHFRVLLTIFYHVIFHIGDLSDVNAKIPLICGMEQQNEEHEEDDGSLLDYPVFELKSVQKRPIKMSSNIIKPSVKAKDLSVVDFTSIPHIASEKVYSITQDLLVKTKTSRRSYQKDDSADEETIKPLFKKKRNDTENEIIENDTEEIATTSGNHSQIVTKTIKTNAKVGRPKSAANECYPLGNAQFQHKLFMHLNDHKERLKNIEKSQKRILEFISNKDNEDGNNEIIKAETIDQLKEINSKLIIDALYKSKMKKVLEVVGLTCSNARQHINGAINTVMSVNIQTKVNVLYGNHIPNKEYCDRVSLRRELPNIFQILVDVVSKTWSVSVKELQKFMSEWLKNVPKKASKESFA